MSVFIDQSTSTISDPSLSTAILFGLYIVLVGFFILLIFSRYKIKQERKKLKEEIKKLTSEIRGKNTQLNSAESRNSQIQSKYKERIENLEHQLRDAYNKNTPSTRIDNSFKREPENQHNSALSENYEEIEPVVVNFKVDPTFYLGFPDTEGAFYAPEATESPTEMSFYKIRNSKLYLYEDAAPETMHTALNFIENHVKRACVVGNAREPFHTRLVMEEPGKVEKVDEDFKIIEKLKVRYE